MSVAEKLGITEGPWRYAKSCDADYGGFIVGKNNNDQVITGGKDKFHDKHGVNEDKDGFLIAAAPEMLEALIEIREHLPQLSSLPIKTKTRMGEATRAVENAIEKATGKSWAEIKELIK